MNREATKIRRKNELLATSKKHQEGLSQELNTSSERVVEFGKNMAVLGSVIYVGYTVLVRFLEAKLKTTKKNRPRLHKEPRPAACQALRGRHRRR